MILGSRETLARTDVSIEALGAIDRGLDPDVILASRLVHYMEIQQKTVPKLDLLAEYVQQVEAALERSTSSQAVQSSQLPS